MSDHWDEFSISLADKSVPRRQSLRLLGAALAGALLSPLGVGTAWAGGPDPCKSFCNQCPKSRRSNCLTSCRACNNNPSRLCGNCWSGFSCCATGESCCSGYCADLADDFDHCGACGHPCEYPDRYEDGACVDGHCFYWCASGAVVCDGRCSRLDADPDNCGACGNVCPDATPVCISGVCSECYPGSTNCGGYCAFLDFDSNNCGACGFVCPNTGCADGVCDSGSPPSEW
jgi:hypothetical protein